MVSNKKLFIYLLGCMLYALRQYIYSEERKNGKESFSDDGRGHARNKQIPIIVGKNETAYMFRQGVCIDRVRRTEGNIITVYNAEYIAYKNMFGYWVRFLTEPFPNNEHTYYENHNAYFLQAKGGLFRNMDHCFKDILVTLFQLLKSLGHLKNTSNVLFTTEERGQWPDFNFGWLDVLNINTKLFPGWNYKNVPPGTCFSTAIFANPTHESFHGKFHRSQDVKEVVSYLLNAYNITEDVCHKQVASQPTITIIARRVTRKILNLQVCTAC